MSQKYVSLHNDPITMNRRDKISLLCLKLVYFGLNLLRKDLNLLI